MGMGEGDGRFCTQKKRKFAPYGNVGGQINKKYNV